jgi:hypothetical protein
LDRGACDRLIAHFGDGVRRWPDKGDALVHACLGEVLALGQEAVAGVDGIRARFLGDVENAVDA